MACYRHALVLIEDQNDGLVLLEHAASVAESLDMTITLAHISDDYRSMNYVADSMMNDVVADEIIRAKTLFSQLLLTTPHPVNVRHFVTLRRLEEIEQCIRQSGIDLLIAGHRNRLMSMFTSRCMSYINNLDVDVMIKHILPAGQK